VLVSLRCCSICLAQDVHFGEDSFDKVTFSQMTQLEARMKCDEALQNTVVRTDQSVDLAPAQLEKLLTAGQLDIHRFFARYESAKRSIHFGNVPRDRWQEHSAAAHASVRPLAQQFLHGLHGEESLLNKTMRNMLDPETFAKVKRAKEEAARAEYSEQIDAALLVIGRGVQLTPEKREAIRDKLLSQTEPPAIFGRSLMPLYFVLANMGEIEDELRELFGEQEWRTLNKLIEAGRTATR
jgi:hypothetical protein